MNKLFAGNKTIQDIVNDYSDMLLRIAFQNIKSLSDAEDIVQGTYIKLINTNTDFNNEEHLKAWLIRVTINKCKDHFKSSWFKKTVLISENMDFLAPEEKGIMKEIFSIDNKYRNVIYLYYYEGYSIKAIGLVAACLVMVLGVIAFMPNVSNNNNNPNDVADNTVIEDP